MAGLVEEGPPIVGPALRLHHQHYAARYLDRRAERPGILARALVEVELDVLLGAEVDAEVREGALESRQHPVGRERRVPGGAAPGPAHVPALDLAERDVDARAEEAVARLHPEVLRIGEQAPALLREIVEGEAEAPVEVGIAVGTELPGLALDDPCSLPLQPVEVLLGKFGPRRLDPLPDVAMLLVDQSRPEHPERDLRAVDGGGQGGLELGNALLLRAHEVPEVARARELPQLAPAAGALDRCPQPDPPAELPPAHR